MELERYATYSADPVTMNISEPNRYQFIDKILLQMEPARDIKYCVTHEREGYFYTKEHSYMPSGQNSDIWRWDCYTKEYESLCRVIRVPFGERDAQFSYTSYLVGLLFNSKEPNYSVEFLKRKIVKVGENSYSIDMSIYEGCSIKFLQSYLMFNTTSYYSVEENVFGTIARQVPASYIYDALNTLIRSSLSGGNGKIDIVSNHNGYRKSLAVYMSHFNESHGIYVGKSKTHLGSRLCISKMAYDATREYVEKERLHFV